MSQWAHTRFIYIWRELRTKTRKYLICTRFFAGSMFEVKFELTAAEQSKQQKMNAANDLNTATTASESSRPMNSLARANQRESRLNGFVDCYQESFSISSLRLCFYTQQFLLLFHYLSLTSVVTNAARRERQQQRRSQNEKNVNKKKPSLICNENEKYRKHSLSLPVCAAIPLFRIFFHILIFSTPRRARRMALEIYDTSRGGFLSHRRSDRVDFRTKEQFK